MAENLITEIFDEQKILEQIDKLKKDSEALLTSIRANVEEIKAMQGLTNKSTSGSEIIKNTEKLNNATNNLKNTKTLYEATETRLQKLQEQQIFLSSEEGKKITGKIQILKDEIKIKNNLIAGDAKLNEALSLQENTISNLKEKLKAYQGALENVDITTEEGQNAQKKYKEEIERLNVAINENTDVVTRQKRNIGNYKSALEGLEQGTVGYREATRIVREELLAMDLQIENGVKLTKEQEEKYRQLNDTMGKLADIQGDVASRTKVLSDDYRNMTFAMEGVKLGVNVMTSLQSLTALLGNDNEKLQKAMAKVVATQQILNTITQIQNQINKDSIIMVNLRLAAETQLKVAIEAGTVAQNTSIASLGFLQKAIITTRGVMETFGKGIIAGAFFAALAGMYKMIKDNINGAKEYEKKLKEDRARQNYIATLKEMAKKTKDLKTQTEQTTTAITDFDGAITLLNESTANGIALNNDFFNSIVRQGMAAQTKKAIELMNEYLVLQDKLKNTYTPGGADEHRVKEIEGEMGNLMIAMKNSKENAEDLIKVLSGGSIFGKQTLTLSYFQKIMEMSKKVEGTSVTPTPTPTATTTTTTTKTIEETSAYADVVEFLSQDLIKLNEAEKKLEFTRIEKYNEALKKINEEFKAGGDEELYAKKLGELDENFAEMENAEKIKGMNAELEVYLAQVERLNAIMQRGQIVDDEEVNSAIGDLQDLYTKILTLRGEILKLSNTKIDVKAEVDDGEVDKVITLFDILKAKYKEFLQIADGDENEKILSFFQRLSDAVKNSGISVEGFKKISAQAMESVTKLAEQGFSTLMGNLNVTYEASAEKTRKAYEEEAEAQTEWINENIENEEQRARLTDIINRQVEEKNAEMEYQSKLRQQNQDAVMAIINGISAGMNYLKNSKTIIDGLPQLAIATATGVAQAMLIKSQKIPKYAVGVDFAPTGFAEVAEKGRELILSPDKKNAYLATGRQIINLKGGEKIFPNFETEQILKSTFGNNVTGNNVTNNNIQKSEVIVTADTFVIAKKTEKQMQRTRLINSRLNVKI